MGSYTGGGGGGGVILDGKVPTNSPDGLVLCSVNNNDIM